MFGRARDRGGARAPPCLQTAAALLSPFLVPGLQLLGSTPQEDVVLFLGVVVLMALKNSHESTILT